MVHFIHVRPRTLLSHARGLRIGNMSLGLTVSIYGSLPFSMGK